MPKSAEQQRFVWATRPFGYNIPKNGPELDRGQIFELEGFPGDERLVRLGFVEEVDLSKVREPHLCPECGARFMEISQRSGHVRKRHGYRRDAREEDLLDSQEERSLSQVAPIRFENTEASRK